MTFHYPDYTTIVINPSQKESGEFSIVYYEKYLPKEDIKDVAKMISNTVDIAKKIIKNEPLFEITFGEDWVQLYHPSLSREQIGTYLTGEFLAWEGDPYTLESTRLIAEFYKNEKIK